MKKIIFSLIIGSALILNSCENDFDPKIYGSLFSTNFPKSEADLESYLMTCYLPFLNTWGYNLGVYQQPWYITTSGFLRMFDSPSDYGNSWRIGNWGGGWLQISQGTFTNCTRYARASSDGSPSHFEKVRNITRFTEIIGVLESAGPEIMSSDPAKLNSFIGEARLLRGMVMYYLLHVYGPVPVILDPALVGDFEAESNLVRPTLAEMSGFIYDDFEFAIKNMSETAIHGRYTADFARFFMMRHCLNEGSHIPGYYDKAIEMYGALKASGRYSLYTAGGDAAYANQFKQANKWNSELIMAMSTSAAGDGTNPKGDFNPIWLYMMPNNVNKSAVLPNGEANPFAVYNGQAWGQVYNISPAFYDSYEEGDLRRDVIVTSYYQTNGNLNSRENVSISWSGFILNKFPIEINQQFQPTDIPLARWADVLLMYGEAVARKTNAVPTGEAMDAISAVRARAGLQPMSGEQVSSYENFMDALLMERGHELLYEGHRKIDLIRFNKYRHNIQKYKEDVVWDFTIYQYMPIPNFAVLQAEEEYGKTLEQWFERPEYAQDN
jgi:hypothetical protein